LAVLLLPSVRRVQLLRRVFFSGIFFIGTGSSIASFRNLAARKRSVLASRAFVSSSTMACAALVVASPFVSDADSFGWNRPGSERRFIVSPNAKKAGRTRPSPQRLNGQCQYIRGHGPEARISLRGFEVLGGALAVPVILHDVEADLLAFGERLHSRALDGRDVDEHVGLPIAQFDEAEAFGGIEELDGSRVHDDFLSIGIEFRRLAKRQTPYFSKLRGKIIRAPERRNKVHQQVRLQPYT
jgi:hypothetical protein